MLEVLAIADDLTGALEVGAKFSARGLPALVTTRDGTEFDTPVGVIDTESRHLSAADAEQCVFERATIPARWIYKKTDSTLRGNIAAELRALVRRYGPARVAYVGPYPSLGRTVRDGILYVKGIPVSDTEFGRDPLNPVRDSRLRMALDPEWDCIVFDGGSDEDVMRAARDILDDPRIRIVAGPAAIAGALAGCMCRDDPSHCWPSLPRCLVVNGSRSAVSARQVEVALASGIVSQDPSAHWRLLISAEPAAVEPLDFARQTGRCVAALGDRYDGLMVFGGDTAFGILEALGCPDLRPIGEILPGVPVSRIAGRRQILVSKAGGFGEDSLIVQLEKLLNGNKR